MATFSGGEIRGGIEIPFLRNGIIDERRAKIQTTEKGIRIASESVSLQKLEVIRQATQKYWDWVAAGKKLGIARELLNIADVRDKALLHRVKHGDAASIEQTENQRAVVQRQSTLLSAERYVQKMTLELSLYFRDTNGMPVMVSSARLPTHFPEPDEHSECLLKKQYDL
jgi:outer membrane protein TolC